MWGTIDSKLHYSDALIREGQFTSAREQLHDAEQLVKRIGSVRQEIRISQYVASVAIELGKWDEAIRPLNSKVLPLAVSADMSNSVIAAFILLSQASFRHGNYQDAEDYAQDALADAARAGDCFEAAAQISLVEARLGLRKLNDALLVDAERALELALRCSDVEQVAEAHCVLGRVRSELQLGDSDRSFDAALNVLKDSHAIAAARTLYAWSWHTGDPTLRDERRLRGDAFLQGTQASAEVVWESIRLS